MFSLPHARFGVIDDARRRQHRRRLGLSMAFLAALAAFVLAGDEPAGDRPATPPRVVRFVEPSRVLAREPYMGVACNVPSSTRCDRFGLGVWVKRPAVAVTAEIRGRKFPLGDRYWITTQHGHRRLEFDGYLRRAGLKRHYHLPARWIGANPTPHPSVRLWIDYGHGPILETRLRVWLMAGWG